jgi:hypothetical protein
MTFLHGAVSKRVARLTDRQCDARNPYPVEHRSQSRLARCTYRVGHPGPHYDGWVIWHNPAGGLARDDR